MGLMQALANVVGEKNLILKDISERYQHDWSAEKAGVPIAVVRPSTTEELSSILSLCSEHNQKIVVQGGLTGLCGGGNPQANELAISLERLKGIEEIDLDSMTMTVRAGTPLEEIQHAADEAGFMFPLDLGARGTCNIGGNISTNAGGNQVLRFGMTRALVLGLETVMADGTVISSMNKMLKNNAAYDLKHLFIGTEGTLGVVSRAVLRLFPRSKSRCSALLALNSFENVTRLLRSVSKGFGGSLSTFEVMWNSYFHHIVDNVERANSPFSEKYPFYVLTELEGADEDRDQELFENTLAKTMEDGLVVDAVIANSDRERDSFWHIRDGVGDIGPFLRSNANFDVSLPISSMFDFLNKLKDELESEVPGTSLLVFGHIADSNLHIVGVNDDKTLIKSIYSVLYRVIGEFNGSISAEHGIGVQKLDYLHYSRTPEEIALMQTLKKTLDPKGILNSGRVVNISDS